MSRYYPGHTLLGQGQQGLPPPPPPPDSSPRPYLSLPPLKPYAFSGKAREMDSRTTVFKRNDDVVYQLKMKTSRSFLVDTDKRFGNMPFTLRSFEDEKKAKMGVLECERHNLVKPFQVSHWSRRFPWYIPTGMALLDGRGPFRLETLPPGRDYSLGPFLRDSFFRSYTNVMANS